MQVNLNPRDFLQKESSVLVEPTPYQTAGPFYPGIEHFTRGNDLTQSVGPSPEGDVIQIHVRVQDTRKRPLAGARVEIWQACASGKYHHVEDPNTAALDPQFGYWGESMTDESGECLFQTIVPGVYPADKDWDRPPHVHFKVAKDGYRDVVTQMYFKDHPLNFIDQILLEVPTHLRDSLIVDFQPTPHNPTIQSGHFTLTLQRA